MAGPQPVMAATRAGLERVRDERRPQLGFLYSTPAYRRQLEEFGLGDLGAALSDMARRSAWDDLAAHLSDDAIDTLLPQGTYEEIPSVLEAWYAGRCDGIGLTLPGGTAEDDRYRELVARCRAIEPVRR